MKVRYNREKDIILLELSSEAIDFAEEAGPIIVHFSKDEKPVLLEILDASEVITALARITMKVKETEATEMSI